MKKGLSVRDLITTGILAALYMVCAMIGEAIFGFFPVLTFLCPLSIALLCGPVYMLILAKVPKHGPIIVTGILVGGVLFVLGMYWSMCLAYCILGVVADLLAGSGNFRNKGRNLLSYMIFVLSPVFSYGMLWFDRDAYVQYLVEKGTEQTYMDTMVSTAQNWMISEYPHSYRESSYFRSHSGKIRDISAIKFSAASENPHPNTSDNRIR